MTRWTELLKFLALWTLLVTSSLGSAQSNPPPAGQSLFRRALSSARRMLQLGVTDATRLLPPVFLEFHDPGIQPSLPVLQEFDCQDRADWTFTWPGHNPLQYGGVFCAEYGPGGVGENFCDHDVGFAIWSQTWMTASEACPRTCGTCCQHFCARSGLGVSCEMGCNQSMYSPDPYLNYLLYAEHNIIPRGEIVKPYETFLNFSRNGSDVVPIYANNQSFSVGALMFNDCIQESATKTLNQIQYNL